MIVALLFLLFSAVGLLFWLFEEPDPRNAITINGVIMRYRSFKLGNFEFSLGGDWSVWVFGIGGCVYRPKRLPPSPLLFGLCIDIGPFILEVSFYNGKED